MQGAARRRCASHAHTVPGRGVWCQARVHSSGWEAGAHDKWRGGLEAKFGSKCLTDWPNFAQKKRMAQTTNEVTETAPRETTTSNSRSTCGQFSGGRERDRLARVYLMRGLGRARSTQAE